MLIIYCFRMRSSRVEIGVHKIQFALSIVSYDRAN